MDPKKIEQIFRRSPKEEEDDEEQADGEWESEEGMDSSTQERPTTPQALVALLESLKSIEDPQELQAKLDELTQKAQSEALLYADNTEAFLAGLVGGVDKVIFEQFEGMELETIVADAVRDLEYLSEGKSKKNFVLFNVGLLLRAIEPSSREAFRAELLKGFNVELIKENSKKILTELIKPVFSSEGGGIDTHSGFWALIEQLKSLFPEEDFLDELGYKKSRIIENSQKQLKKDCVGVLSQIAASGEISFMARHGNNLANWLETLNRCAQYGGEDFDSESAFPTDMARVMTMALVKDVCQKQVKTLKEESWWKNGFGEDSKEERLWYFLAEEFAFVKDAVMLFPDKIGEFGLDKEVLNKLEEQLKKPVNPASDSQTGAKGLYKAAYLRDLLPVLRRNVS